MSQTHELVIRPFDNSDRQRVVDLWNVVFTDEPPWNDPEQLIARKLTVQPELFLVGALGDRIVGALMAGFDGVRGWIHHLAVHPEARGRGVATKLVRAAESGLATMGCPKVNLQVRETNREVLAFYHALGYSTEARESLGRRL